MKRDLVGQVVDAIIHHILTGHYREGEALPAEVVLSQELDVSRLTVREGVKILKERGVLDVVQGRGTFVTPRSQWTDLSTVISLALHESSQRTVGLELTELRMIIEVEACALAARCRTHDDLEALGAQLESMETASDDGDVRANVEADLAFHRTILRASGNPFIPVVMSPLQDALAESRFVTASQPEVRARAQAHHKAILRAIEAGDQDAARDAMRAHIIQTRHDLIAYTPE